MAAVGGVATRVTLTLPVTVMAAAVVLGAGLVGVAAATTAVEWWMTVTPWPAIAEVVPFALPEVPLASSAGGSGAGGSWIAGS